MTLYNVPVWFEVEADSAEEAVAILREEIHRAGLDGDVGDDEEFIEELEEVE